MEKCPIANKLEQKINKLMRIVRKAKREGKYDMPEKKDVKAWLKKNDFQPWMDEEVVEDEELEEMNFLRGRYEKYCTPRMHRNGKC